MSDNTGAKHAVEPSKIDSPFGAPVVPAAPVELGDDDGDLRR
ncbi:hypothetical protein [Rhodococcus jostii]|uniref:Uncharacterized protein n=1 Tax=Rhodococcus jostii TaxID=132919 RepID=A0ABU4C9E1_RHOJO|nr:hypothetical protein [Rhodococcus jostii]MDV6280170.1 hypothetical protein [Rhodococcus jostii]